MVSPTRETRAEPVGGDKEEREEGDDTEDEDELSSPSSQNDPRPINGKCGFLHWDQCIMANGVCLRTKLRRVRE